MEKKSGVSEQNFTEAKAIHFLCSVMQSVKLSFIINNFEKWREVMVLNLLNLVLKRYGKSMENDFFKCVGTLISDQCKLNIFADVSPKVPPRHLQTHAILSGNLQNVFHNCA